jgi:iron complex outermembrane receptor protein
MMVMTDTVQSAPEESKMKDIRLLREGELVRNELIPARVLVFLLILFAASSAAPAQAAETREGGEISDYSIEELMNLDIRTLSRKPEKLVAATASVSVLTREDIRRSPATNIPELLSMVPGLQVYRINENNWNIKAHGFDQSFGGNFLLLIDGRKLSSNPANRYVLLVEELLIEDVERIEIIKGPGAVSWGARAHNGVINIITRNSRYTQGFMASAEGGLEKEFRTGLRYGGRLGEDSFYRLNLKYMNGDLALSSEEDVDDQWDFISGGFRLDLNPSVDRHFMIEGSYKSKYITNTFRYPFLYCSSFQLQFNG